MTLDEAKAWMKDRWLLHTPIERPSRPLPPHLESRGKVLARERDWRKQWKAKQMQGAL